MTDNTIRCAVCRVTLTMDWDPIAEAVVGKRDGKIHGTLGFVGDGVLFDPCPGDV